MGFKAPSINLNRKWIKRLEYLLVTVAYITIVETSPCPLAKTKNIMATQCNSHKSEVMLTRLKVVIDGRTSIMDCAGVVGAGGGGRVDGPNFDYVTEKFATLQDITWLRPHGLGDLLYEAIPLNPIFIVQSSPHFIAKSRHLTVKLL
ncbi:hypothetical protein J6590_051586 [Homalodisca vitripennis]|nr:hypothetical protein J6590_051586 [Homalodisca vitripennis]